MKKDFKIYKKLINASVDAMHGYYDCHDHEVALYNLLILIIKYEK